MLRSALTPGSGVGGSDSPEASASASSSSAGAPPSRRARISARITGSQREPNNPLDDEYDNPLDSVSRWRLSANAMALRSAASFAFSMSNRSSPPPPAPSRTLWLDSTLSQWPGEQVIRVDVFEPGDQGQSKGSGGSTPPPGGYGDEDGSTEQREKDASGQFQNPAATSNDQVSAESKAQARLELKDDSSSSPGSAPRRETVDAQDASPDRGLGSTANTGVDRRGSGNDDARKRMAVINFHGGGFILGSGTDDSRWAASVTECLGAVVFSVNYRLAPGFPYPTPVEDAVDSIVQIVARADELCIDPEQVHLSGFSAGGTLALASWTVLQDPGRWGYFQGHRKTSDTVSPAPDPAPVAASSGETAVREKQTEDIKEVEQHVEGQANQVKEQVQQTKDIEGPDVKIQIQADTDDKKMIDDARLSTATDAQTDTQTTRVPSYSPPANSSSPGSRPLPPSLPSISIAGMILFYPVLDWTIPRNVKRQLCCQPDQTLPQSMTDLIDASYIYPPIPHKKRDDPRLSPGLIPAEMMARLPPIHMCLCELDMLMNEGLKFAERVREAGGHVTTRVAMGEKHAWDKTPLFAPKCSVAVEYQAAIVAMRHWVNGDAGAFASSDVGDVDAGEDTGEEVDVPLRVKDT